METDKSADNKLNNSNNSPNHHLKHFLVDFNSGFIGGILSVLTGHPCDTLKTRCQIKKQNLLKLIKKMYLNEGMWSFFKGMSFPLYSIPIVNSVVFSSNELTKKILKLNQDMSFFEGFISGAVAGTVACVVVTPVELVKCRLQLQETSIKESKYKGAFDCARQIIKFDGVRGLYSGLLITVLRDLPAYSAQFAGYHFLKKKISSKLNKDYSNNSLSELMICGGFAGYCCWQASYPQVCFYILGCNQDVFTN